MTQYLQFLEQQQQEFSDFCGQLLHVFRKFIQLHLFTGSFCEMPPVCCMENITDIDKIRYRRNICAISKDFKGTVLII